MKYTLKIEAGVCKVRAFFNNKNIRIDYIGSPLMAKEYLNDFIKAIK
jgi:hypothetical protein